jgi:dihydroceramidase
MHLCNVETWKQSEFLYKTKSTFVDPILIKIMPPYWNITSSIDWCEENYVYSNYIAEFWNTISSTSMIFIGKNSQFCFNFLGILLMFKQTKINSKTRPTSMLMIFIGIGSVLFHMTLSRYSQALDEVPMIWVALHLIYLATNELFKNDSSNTLWFWYRFCKSDVFILYGIFTSICITFTTGDLQFTLFHVNNTIISILVVLCFYVLSTRKDLNEYHNTYTTFKTGLLLFGVALCCWSFDLFFCDYLDYIQLHAFWHVFSSLGFYNLIKVLDKCYLYNYKDSLKKIV